MYTCIPGACAGQEEGVEFSGTGVPDGLKLPSGCWELNDGLCRSSKCSVVESLLELHTVGLLFWVTWVVLAQPTAPPGFTEQTGSSGEHAHREGVRGGASACCAQSLQVQGVSSCYRPLPDRSIIQKSLSTYYKMESCLPTSHLVSEAGTVTFYNEMSTEVDRVQTGGGFCWSNPPMSASGGPDGLLSMRSCIP